DLLGFNGGLRWLVNARPDCSYAAGEFASIAGRGQMWEKAHWAQAQQLCGFLRATKDCRMVFRRSDRFNAEVRTNGTQWDLEAYSDADWATDKSDRKSISGNCILLGGAAIIATSKKQTTVADSTVYAETDALYSLVKKVVW